MACCSKAPAETETEPENDDFFILFTNDVHCRINEGIGYDGKDFYAQVQNAADLAKTDGADYVVALSHVGYDESIVPYDVCSLVENTNGIDVFLDAQLHRDDRSGNTRLS